jgi:cell division protease FtsH
MLTRQALAATCTHELAELAALLQAGRSCLVECDKGLTPFLYADLRGRLRAANLSSVYVDGRPRQDESPWSDWTVMTTMLAQLRKAVRLAAERCVVVVPHLDVLAADAAGLSPVAREVIPLLYEVPEQVWLAFRDPSLPLLPVVAARFVDRLIVPRPTGGNQAAGPATAEGERAAPAPAEERSS